MYTLFHRNICITKITKCEILNHEKEKLKSKYHQCENL